MKIIRAFGFLLFCCGVTLFPGWAWPRNRPLPKPSDEGLYDDRCPHDQEWDDCPVCCH